MPTTRSCRKDRSIQLDLFRSSQPRPTWDRLPESCRPELSKLVARMLIERIAPRLGVGAGEEADHE